jgi:hypothetical protein
VAYCRGCSLVHQQPSLRFHLHWSLLLSNCDTQHNNTQQSIDLPFVFTRTLFHIFWLLYKWN